MWNACWIETLQIYVCTTQQIYSLFLWVGFGFVTNPDRIILAIYCTSKMKFVKSESPCTLLQTLVRSHQILDFVSTNEMDEVLATKDPRAFDRTMHAPLTYDLTII